MMGLKSRVKYVVMLVMALFISLGSGLHHARADEADFSDLWWVPSESGWGVTVNHQSGILVATFFIYPPGGGAGTFYQSTMLRGSKNEYVGDLYQFSAPPQANGVPNGSVIASPVGRASIKFSTSEAGALSFSIGDQPFAKNITRYTIAEKNMSGSYLAASSVSYSCNSNQSTGTLFNFAVSTVVHDKNKVSLVVEDDDGVCTHTSTNFTQSGQMGRFSGAYSCTNGDKGTFKVSDVQITAQGVTQLIEFATATGCSVRSRVSAVKIQ